MKNTAGSFKLVSLDSSIANCIGSIVYCLSVYS